MELPKGFLRLHPLLLVAELVGLQKVVLEFLDFYVHGGPTLDGIHLVDLVLHRLAIVLVPVPLSRLQLGGGHLACRLSQSGHCRGIAAVIRMVLGSGHRLIDGVQVAVKDIVADLQLQSGDAGGQTVAGTLVGGQLVAKLEDLLGIVEGLGEEGGIRAVARAFALGQGIGHILVEGGGNGSLDLVPDAFELLKGGQG